MRITSLTKSTPALQPSLALRQGVYPAITVTRKSSSGIIGQCAISSMSLCRHYSVSHRHRALIISQAAAAEGKQKRSTVAELKARIDELQEENTALRAALAAIRGYDGASVDYETDDEDTFPLGPSPTIRKKKRNKTRPEDGMLEDEEAAAMAVLSTPMQFSALASMDEVVSLLENGIVWPQPGESNPLFYNRAPRSAPLQVPEGHYGSRKEHCWTYRNVR
ncbi:hypothetical protein KSW81_005207 [Nannochloris sp. 'desiccata']|nr:hypothetical protein KSW81_005207 [Chlorella desiccata (nom. nud.)]